MMSRSFIDRIVYHTTTKPSHYREVRNPPRTVLEKLVRPQDARQMQYNQWSRAHHVYSGSYLPKNADALLQQGWEQKKVTTGGVRIMQRKSTGQTVRKEKHGDWSEHYHWLDFWKKNYTGGDFRRFNRREFGGQNVYYNKYGELISRRDPEHHLYGED